MNRQPADDAANGHQGAAPVDRQHDDQRPLQRRGAHWTLSFGGGSGGGDCSAFSWAVWVMVSHSTGPLASRMTAIITTSLCSQTPRAMPITLTTASKAHAQRRRTLNLAISSASVTPAPWPS